MYRMDTCFFSKWAQEVTRNRSGKIRTEKIIKRFMGGPPFNFTALPAVAIKYYTFLRLLQLFSLSIMGFKGRV